MGIERYFAHLIKFVFSHPSTRGCFPISYANIVFVLFQVVHDMKRDSKTVTDERHKAATVLQATLQQITPMAEHRMKTTATFLAKQYYEKVQYVAAPMMQYPLSLLTCAHMRKAGLGNQFCQSVSLHEIDR